MSKQMTYDKLDLLGTQVDAISIDQSIEYICARSAPGQPACYVIKPYVEFLDRAYNNKAIRETLNDAELAIPDGVALLWAASYLYAGPRTWLRFCTTLFRIVLAPDSLRWPLPDRTAGINFTWPLLTAASTAGRRVYLIGKTTESDIQATERKITAKLPQLVIASTRSGRDTKSRLGTVSQAWLAETATAITAAKPDIILIGMGFPLQERVCAYLAANVPHGVFIGEGGTFDYQSFGGSQQKAPAWIQRVGLEWLWRLTIQPSRIGRQLAIPRFIFRIARTK